MRNDVTQHTDPYQYSSARAAGSQETTNTGSLPDVSGMAVDRYADQSLSYPQNYVNVGKGERAVSLLGGLALAAYGARKRTPGALALAAAGGALLYRGTSGHCPINSAIGRNSAQH